MAIEKTFNTSLNPELLAQFREILLDSHQKELERMLVPERKKVVEWLLQSLINRKWVVAHTDQVLQSDATSILKDVTIRDYILNLTSWFMSRVLPFDPFILDAIVEWRVSSARVFSVKSDWSLLNPELNKTLECDETTYSNILMSNPWLTVYGFLLETLDTKQLAVQVQELILAATEADRDAQDTNQA